MTQQLAEVHFPQREERTAHLETDRQAQATLAALIARDAPGTRAYRVRWSQGETQVLELGVGQVDAVRELAPAGASVSVVPDLAGLDRVVRIGTAP